MDWNKYDFGYLVNHNSLILFKMVESPHQVTKYFSYTILVDMTEETSKTNEMYDWAPSSQSELFNGALQGLVEVQEAEQVIVDYVNLITYFIDAVRCLKLCNGKKIGDTPEFDKMAKVLLETGVGIKSVSSPVLSNEQNVAKITRSTLQKLLFYFNHYILGKCCYSKKELAIIMKDVLNKIITRLIYDIASKELIAAMNCNNCECRQDIEFFVVSNCEVVLNRCLLLFNTQEFITMNQNNQFSILMGENDVKQINNFINGVCCCDDKKSKCGCKKYSHKHI